MYCSGVEVLESGNSPVKVTSCVREAHPDLDSVSHDAVHDVLGERVKVFVHAPHELWLQQEATATVVLKHTHVQLHGQV